MKEQLISLGFHEQKRNKLIVEIESYPIIISYDASDPRKSTIDYGQKIKVWSKTTCNLLQDESMVVLECVLRLLKKGYRPDSIELEKTWKSGRGTSGRLDILIKNRGKGILAMIECKTWGDEYEKERNQILENGGQIFSYGIQERSTKYLVLYTSQIGIKIDYQSECVDLAGIEGTSNEELHQS